MSHTPGPWTMNKYDELVAPDGRRIVVWGSGIAFGQRSDETEANARLIAAAPELLEMLKDVLRVVSDSDHWWMDCPSRGGFDADAIGALIAKAEGQS